MSISLNIPPTIRPFRGYEDPALPDGYWAAHAALLGDASGGLQSINIRISTAAQPSASLIWSMEQLAIHSAVGGGVNLRIDYGGFDVFPVGISTSALVKLLHVQLNDLGTAAGGSGLKLEDSAVPVFLGSARKDVNVDLSFDVDNNDGLGFSVFVQGYFWGPGAVNAPGGPQRPVAGLYAK